MWDFCGSHCWWQSVPHMVTMTFEFKFKWQEIPMLCCCLDTFKFTCWPQTTHKSMSQTNKKRFIGKHWNIQINIHISWQLLPFLALSVSLCSQYVIHKHTQTWSRKAGQRERAVRGSLVWRSGVREECDALSRWEDWGNGRLWGCMVHSSHMGLSLQHLGWFLMCVSLQGGWEGGCLLVSVHGGESPPPSRLLANKLESESCTCDN